MIRTLLLLSAAAASAQPVHAATSTQPDSTPSTPSAQTAAQQTTAADALPAITVTGNTDDVAQLHGDGTANVTRSTTPILKTPQSITVVNRALLDDQQAHSLADALYNVPGVVANTYGRRGWDDFIIRGETASGDVFLDGLRTSTANRVAEEVFGMEQVEVLKGPASLLSGFVEPGGMVNLVSKTPKDYAFANIDTMLGSHDFRQATFDMGIPLSASGKAAFRVDGLISNSNDETNDVWFKKRYIAPSISFDLGSRTDFTILASYQEGSYIRQQGLPLYGTVYPNKNGKPAWDTFTGEPGAQPYRYDQTRIGYTFTHRFDSGWTFHNNLRWEDFSVNGQLVANGALASNQSTLSRTATSQSYFDTVFTTDANVQKTVDLGVVKQEFTAGVDYLRDEDRAASYTCTVGKINLFNPAYGSAIVCPTKPKTNATTTVNDVGFYLRDQLTFAQRWHILGGVRYDSSQTNVLNKSTNGYSGTTGNAFTGSIGVLYDLTSRLSPYLSYATSFYPNSGTDVNGDGFKPETGKQWELGMKYALDTHGSNVTLALYELTRHNVLESDPNNDNYDIAIGEERSRGVEFSFMEDLGHGLSVTGGYSYTNAVIIDDGGQTPSTDGVRLNNVPRHNFSLYTRYRLPNAWHRWEINGGIRGMSDRYAYGYYIPGYTVTNLGVAYHAPRWHAALTLNNLFDKHYYTGGLSQAVALGDVRTVFVSVGYQY